MKDGPSFYVVVLCLHLVVHLLPREDEALLDRRDTLFLFHALLNSLNGIAGVDVNLNLLARKSSDFYHDASQQHWYYTNRASYSVREPAIAGRKPLARGVRKPPYIAASNCLQCRIQLLNRAFLRHFHRAVVP